MTPDLIPIIRDRLIEAARTERKLPLGRAVPAASNSFWPPILYTKEDIDGWGIEERERRAAGMCRRGASAAEVTRMEECMRWITELVSCEQNRRAVLAWAAMKAGGLPIRVWSRREGIEEHTAKRRADRAVAEIAGDFAKRPSLLIAEVDSDLFNECPVSGTDSGMLDELTAERAETPPAHIYPGAHPVDLLDMDDPDVVRRFEKHLAGHNKRMREMQRRRKLGVYEDAAA